LAAQTPREVCGETDAFASRIRRARPKADSIKTNLPRPPLSTLLYLGIALPLPIRRSNSFPSSQLLRRRFVAAIPRHRESRGDCFGL
jgi:hypothetical protein